MPKIKELSNAKLRDYLKAYQAESEIFPSNSEYTEKINQISKVLEIRKASGFDLKGPSIFAKLFKKNKGN